MRTVFAAVAALVAALMSAPTADALPPSPFCPGNGTDVVVMGAGGGWCDFMYTPDGLHVHCEWGGFTLGFMDVASVSNCWRVGPDGHRLDPPPEGTQ